MSKRRSGNFFRIWRNWLTAGKPASEPVAYPVMPLTFAMSQGRADGFTFSVPGMDTGRVLAMWKKYLAKFQPEPAVLAMQPEQSAHSAPLMAPGEHLACRIVLPGLGSVPVNLYAVIRQRWSGDGAPAVAVMVTLDFGAGNMLDRELDKEVMPALRELLVAFTRQLASGRS